MNPVTAFSVIELQASTHESEMMKLEFDINASAATTVYVQVHDFPNAKQLAAGTTVPPNSSVPLKSWPIPAGAQDNYKEFKNGEMSFSYGCFVCVSTTQASLTLGTGSNKFDSISVELEVADVSTSTGYTTTQASSASTVSVWTDASATPHNLLRVCCTNLEAGVRYLMLFSIDSPPNGATPIRQWKLLATGDAGGGDVVMEDFGTGVPGSVEGLKVESQDSSGVLHQGCVLMLSSTTGTLTAVVGSGGNFYAEYV